MRIGAGEFAIDIELDDALPFVFVRLLRVGGDNRGVLWHVPLGGRRRLYSRREMEREFGRLAKDIVWEARSFRATRG